MDQWFYLMTFDSANHGMQVEKRAVARFTAAVIPTPRELSASCGIALRFTGADAAELRAFFDGLDVPCRLYRMGPRGAGGLRPAELLAKR